MEPATYAEIFGWAGALLLVFRSFVIRSELRHFRKESSRFLMYREQLSNTGASK